MTTQAQQTRLEVWRVMVESPRALNLREIQQRVGSKDGITLHLRHFRAAGLIRYENLIDRWRVTASREQRRDMLEKLEQALQVPGGLMDRKVEHARVLYLRLKRHYRPAQIAEATKVPVHFLYQYVGGVKPIVDNRTSRKRIGSLIRFAEQRLKALEELERIDGVSA